MRIKSALAAILALFAVGSAAAQQFPTIPDHTVIGRIGAGGGTGPSQAIPFPTLKSLLLPGALVSVLDFGAVGNGTTDDTAAQQAGINYCVTIGCELYYPPGTYKTTASLTISSRIKIRGAGFQGDSGGGFGGSGVSQSTGFLSSTIVCAATINCIVATTNKSVQIQELQVTYPSTPTPGTAAITIQAIAGAGNANTQSTIHHVMITGADTGIILTNCLDFRINNNDILYGVTYDIIVNSPNFPSFQQASISDNELWGAGNAGFQAHILVQAGGDLRIENNKISTGGVNTNGIAFLGASSGSQNMEPLVVTGNTIEGPQNCIAFSTANASFTASQIVITGNQLWCGGKSLLVNSFGTGQYVIGLTVTGNVLTVNGGAGVNPVQIDNVKNATFTGNTLNCSGGCSASIGFLLSSHTTGIVVSNNSYDAGYTTNVSNSGTSNSVLEFSSGTTGSGAVVLATSPTLITPALGTPSSGVATNLTGTAAGLTAGTVTTDANLTGPVTSVGNATTIGANQVSRANEAQGIARSVVGVIGNATANVADIQLGASQFLGVNAAGTALGGQTMAGDCTLAAPTITCTQSAGDFKVTGLLQTGGDIRTTAQFDKTSSTTFSDIPGLSVTVASGLTYGFEAKLFFTANAASGVRASIGGTCTATAIVFEEYIINTAGFAGVGKGTALGAVASGVTTATGDVIQMHGTITVNAGGTLTSQFAQNVSGGTASSVLVGSTMKVWKIQ
jgi:hypothetical protein